MIERPSSFPDSSATVTPLLAVGDLTRSLSFWVGQVGAAVEVEWETYALLRIGAGRLHLAVTGDPPLDRSVRLVPPSLDDDQVVGEVAVQVTDCRAVVTALLGRGVTFLGPAVEPPWGGEVRAFVRDPDGHLLEITGPTDSVPPEPIRAEPQLDG